MEERSRQFGLIDNQGAHLTCWLEDDSRLRVGVQISLKETGKKRWTIAKRYDLIVQTADIKDRRWKVGGLK